MIINHPSESDLIELSHLDLSHVTEPDPNQQLEAEIEAAEGFFD